MADETPINREAKRRRRLPGAVESAAGAVEEKVLWRAGDAARVLADLCRRLLETVGWAVRKWVIWPLEDRVPQLDGKGRVLGAGGLVLLVAGVGAVALLLGSSGGSGTQASTPIAVTPAAEPAAEPAPEAEPAKAPTLRGAAPVFEKPASAGASNLDGAEPIERAPAQDSGADAEGGSAATATISSSPGEDAPAASASAAAASVKGPPAGAAAVAVARQFAAAFVVYETGGDEAKVRKALNRTATAELSRSLLRRPPRLPANVEVPRAKVVNVVPGPSSGGIYSISVSLLRVGLTSELRLDMEKQKGDGWRVTNVLG